jgi:hypothetical protein
MTFLVVYHMLGMKSSDRFIHFDCLKDCLDDYDQVCQYDNSLLPMMTRLIP